MYKYINFWHCEWGVEDKNCKISDLVSGAFAEVHVGQPEYLIMNCKKKKQWRAEVWQTIHFASPFRLSAALVMETTHAVKVVFA